MATTTPADHQTIEDLYSAMMLLEMHGTDMFSEPDADCALVVAAHAIIQNVAQRMQGKCRIGRGQRGRAQPGVPFTQKPVQRADQLLTPVERPLKLPQV